MYNYRNTFIHTKYGRLQSNYTSTLTTSTKPKEQKYVTYSNILNKLPNSEILIELDYQRYGENYNSIVYGSIKGTGHILRCGY